MRIAKTAISMAVLFASVLALGASSRTEALTLDAIEDSYVVVNFADELDQEGLRERNFGNQDFTRTWYAWQTVGNEQVVAVSLFKFDLGSIKSDRVESAHLQLYAIGTNLKVPARLVDVNLVEGTWSETSLTYNSRPSYPSTIATTAVYGPNVWYTWDVSTAVEAEARRTGTVSFAIGLRAIEQQSEEQVIFVSRETKGNHVPRLIVTYDASGEMPIIYFAVGGGVALLLVVLSFIAGRAMSRRRRRGSSETPVITTETAQ